MARLWEGGGVEADRAVAEYTAADDAVLDNHIIGQDLATNAAHVRMLAACGYLAESERDAILGELATIRELWRQGRFVIQPEDEDVHTRIETTVTAAIGEPGRRIHTGRSRNDQVLTDMRLFIRLRLVCLADEALALAGAFDAWARRYSDIAMPGYTHMQRAMPSSVALWAGAFAEALVDDAAQLYAQYGAADACPLGSGAGYGVSLGIDREMTADLLGFSRVQYNPIHCQNSRGRIEGMALAAVSGLMMTLGRFATDMLLFTTAEYDFFEVEKRLTTGSSIMPQKKNLDIMELLRARVRTVQACEQLVKSIPGGLPSGYARDLQETKKPIIDAFAHAEGALAIVGALLGGMTPKRERMLAALSPDIYATDEVFRLVEGGTPFRDAYRKVKDQLDEVVVPSAGVVPDVGATPGTPANPALDAVRGRIEGQAGVIRQARAREEGLLDRLLSPW